MLAQISVIVNKISQKFPTKMKNYIETVENNRNFLK